ncbi:hypothetical protein ACSQ67_002630 [Phaseolus vulgaris]
MLRKWNRAHNSTTANSPSHHVTVPPADHHRSSRHRRAKPRTAAPETLPTVHCTSPRHTPSRRASPKAHTAASRVDRTRSAHSAPRRRKLRSERPRTPQTAAPSPPQQIYNSRVARGCRSTITRRPRVLTPDLHSPRRRRHPTAAP